MTKLVRCKSCGYVMEEGKLGEKCPACGVPQKMFEPYEDKLSDRRRMILNSHIHPVIVHAPQAFAFVLLCLAAVYAFRIEAIAADLLSTIRVMSVLLPLFVLGALLSGLFDGKTRFRKVTTPLLTRKIVAGSVFFACSCAMLALGLTTDLGSLPGLGPFLALNALAFVCSALLGLWGTGLLNAKFPG